MTSFLHNQPLSKFCTFGIGGPARLFATINNIEAMQNAIRECASSNTPYIILGKGSNCLFDDRGFDGAVLLNKIDFFKTTSPGCFHVGAGYSFSLLGSQTARQEWSGLEFASGIPGTVGGAVFMNAGANGRETCESLLSVDYISEKGEICTLKKEELSFAYRTSSFQQLAGAIVGATFGLTHSPEARTKQLEIINYRKRTQPYNDRSAGCIFRNSSCAPAGALIEKSGLKNYRIGDAMVSPVHANFIVNVEQATARQVLELIDIVKKEVRTKMGVDLESEVRYIPYQII